MPAVVRPLPLIASPLAALRGRWRLASGLTMFSFILCHFVAHATLLISVPFAEQVLNWLMAPWHSRPGTALLLAAFTVHYLGALAAIYRRRTLRMAPWEIWQLSLGLCIPLLATSHVASTAIGEPLLGLTPTYASAFVEWFSQNTVYGVLQAAAVLVVWIHGCIGLSHWLKTKPWYGRARRWLGPAALLLPTLALAGFLTGGLQTRREIARDPDLVQLTRDDANSTEATRAAVGQIAWGILAAHFALVTLPFAARMVRAAALRRRRPPQLTLADGRRVAVSPGASVLETLRDRGIPHAAVCGGRARCTTCRVLITEGGDTLPPPRAEEARALARIQAGPGTRLACQIRPDADLTVMPLLSPDAHARDGFVKGGLEGSERLVTVVFVDLRGSTALGENRLPYDVLFLLNHFFKEMTDALEASRGHYSQFTGDGLMALYGLEGDAAEGARDALRGAADMLRRLERLNGRLGEVLAQPLRIGIGMHFSEAIVGAMGPPNSQIISAIGDTVNTCARLESLTKDYGCSLVLSRQVAEAAGMSLPNTPMHETAVKGRAGKVQFYALNEVPVVG
jgi:adenylate cyclase